MMEVTKMTIQREIIRLASHYPEAGLNPEQLNVIADDFFESFRGWRHLDFMETVKKVRDKCRFWPKMIDFNESYQEVIRSRPKLAAPVHECSPAEEAQNKQILKILCRIISQDIGYSEGAKEVGKMIGHRIDEDAFKSSKEVNSPQRMQGATKRELAASFRGSCRIR